MSNNPAQNLDERIDAIESSYEFMLAYAAQGRDTDEGAGGSASELRGFLQAMEQALEGLGATVSAIAPDFKTSPPNVSELWAVSPERPTLRFLASDTG